MKPLLRYTIGNVCEAGFEILGHSVRTAKKFYPDFDICITCNNVNGSNLSFVESLGTEIYIQTGKELNLRPQGTAWKLYPPRLRIDAHEIAVDNDIIFLERLLQVDEFLKSNKTMICEDRYRLFGLFDKNIKKEVKCNSGFYGMPPGFDFLDKFKSSFNSFFNSDIIWGFNSEFDEQGLVTSLIYNESCIIIPLNDFEICEPNINPKFGFKAIHFIGVNKNKINAWNIFKENSKCLI